MPRKNWAPYHSNRLIRKYDMNESPGNVTLNLLPPKNFHIMDRNDLFGRVLHVFAPMKGIKSMKKDAYVSG